MRLKPNVAYGRRSAAAASTATGSAGNTRLVRSSQIFACTRERVIVKADGGQHADSRPDERRTTWLQSRGWRVLRFWNNEIVKNPEGVIDAILRELRGDDPHPAATLWRPPSPALRERG
jgi:hypothetical protein